MAISRTLLFRDTGGRVSIIISSESGVFVCLSLSSRRCLTNTLQSSVACCVVPCSGFPILVVLLVLVVLEFRSVVELVTEVVAAGTLSERLGEGAACVRTVMVKDGGVLRASVTDGPDFTMIDDWVPNKELLVEPDGEVPDAGEVAAGNKFCAGGVTGARGRSFPPLMNLRRAAPISSGDISTSVSSICSESRITSKSLNELNDNFFCCETGILGITMGICVW